MATEALKFGYQNLVFRANELESCVGVLSIKQRGLGTNMDEIMELLKDMRATVITILDNQGDMEYSIKHPGKKRSKSRSRTPAGELDFDEIMKKRKTEEEKLAKKADEIAEKKDADDKKAKAEAAEAAAAADKKAKMEAKVTSTPVSNTLATPPVRRKKKDPEFVIPVPEPPKTEVNDATPVEKDPEPVAEVTACEVSKEPDNTSTLPANDTPSVNEPEPEESAAPERPPTPPVAEQPALEEPVVDDIAQDAPEAPEAANEVVSEPVAVEETAPEAPALEEASVEATNMEEHVETPVVDEPAVAPVSEEHAAAPAANDSTEVLDVAPDESHSVDETVEEPDAFVDEEEDELKELMGPAAETPESEAEAKEEAEEKLRREEELSRQAEALKKLEEEENVASEEPPLVNGVEEEGEEPIVNGEISTPPTSAPSKGKTAKEKLMAKLGVS